MPYTLHPWEHNKVLGFTISSCGIAIRFKYEEKIPQFLCRGESSLHRTSWNLAPPTWATMLVCVTSFQEVPRDENLLYTNWRIDIKKL
jgi:hypothetical protein